MQVTGAKTGYLGSVSGYNFATVLRYAGGPELSIVVLGEQHMYTAFNETTQLASLAQEAAVLDAGASHVAGATVTTSSVN